MLSSVVAFLPVLIPENSMGRVVGVGGATYPIQERDMLEVIQERVASVDQDALLQKMQDDIKEGARTFRPADAITGLPVATKDEEHDLDFTYTVNQPITDMYGKIIYPAGYTFNPLELMRKQGISYPFVIVILNGERKAELDWFENSGLNQNPHVKLWISEGYAYELGEHLRRPVYYLSSALQQRFTISATPSLVFWPLESTKLKIRTVAISDHNDAEESSGVMAGGISGNVEDTRQEEAPSPTANTASEQKDAQRTLDIPKIEF